VEKTIHTEELNDLHSSPNIVRVIKSRKMSWAGHVGRMGERRGLYWVLVVEDHLGDPGVDGRIILSWICRNWDVGV
jgi:hypothetical protein